MSCILNFGYTPFTKIYRVQHSSRLPAGQPSLVEVLDVQVVAFLHPPHFATGGKLRRLFQFANYFQCIAGFLVFGVAQVVELLEVVGDLLSVRHEAGSPGVPVAQ